MGKVIQDKEAEEFFYLIIMITNHHSTSPLISVIMPVYNREEFVGEAIESILHQTYENFELIIADDGSTDGTAPIIHEYARSDRRIRPVFIRHRGIPKTLNTAIEAARGLYIAFADADDVSLPERLIRQSEWMDENRIDISGANAEVFGDSRDMNGWKEGVNWLPESHEAIRREMLFRVALWRGAAMIKTAVCKENPFNENIGLTDCDWPMRMVVKYKMGNVPSVLVRVRRHADNATLIKKTSCLK